MYIRYIYKIKTNRSLLDTSILLHYSSSLKWQTLIFHLIIHLAAIGARIPLYAVASYMMWFSSYVFTKKRLYFESRNLYAFIYIFCVWIYYCLSLFRLRREQKKFLARHQLLIFHFFSCCTRSFGCQINCLLQDS